MELINVVISAQGVAKEPHPSGNAPVKPIKMDFKDETKFTNAMLGYEQAMVKWTEIDITLTTYPIISLKCASGLMVDNKVLNWHIGNKEKAQLLPDGSVIIDGFDYTKQ